MHPVAHLIIFLLLLVVLAGIGFFLLEMASFIETGFANGATIRYGRDPF